MSQHVNNPISLYSHQRDGLSVVLKHCREAATGMYDMLSGLYVVPISESILLRLATFCKLTFCDGVPFSTAKKLFRRRRLDGREAQIMALSRQALLSTAELIKCVEIGATDLSTIEKVMDALYSDENTTYENIGYLMHGSESRASVLVAVTNLFLHKQIIFERVYNPADQRLETSEHTAVL